MKKLLCYLGILLLLGLTFLPPALKIFLPKQDEIKVEKNENISILLSCKSNKYEISTNYENDKVKMLAIKRIKNNDVLISESEINNQENQQENGTENIEEIELDKMFNSLKNANNIIYNDVENAEVIGIDFSIYDHKDLGLNNLIKPSDEQKIYYENQGLTCIIRK